MSEKIVLVLSSKGANDSIRGLMTEFGSALESIGLPVMHVALDPAGIALVQERLLAGQVSFALTWLGFGQTFSVEVGSEPPQSTASDLWRMLFSRKQQHPAVAQPKVVNIWEALGVPLLKFHPDLPAYYSDFHRDVPRNAVNLYPAEEFMQFRRRWMPEEQALARHVPPLPMGPIARDAVDLSVRRRGKIFFLKNGNSPKELRQLWQERLPRPVAQLVANMADEITPVGTRTGILYIGDFISSYLAAKGFDPDSTRRLILFFAAQLDDYLRRIKSTMIAEAVLDLPVVVQGSFWSHVDFTGRRAQWIEGQDFTKSHKIFSEQLGVIDMSPNVNTAPHDGVQRGAGSYATVLSDRLTWFEANFPEFLELTFDLDPESIRARVADAIARPDKYLELGVAFGERYRELYTREAFAHRVLEMAELARLQWSEKKPLIQNFFVWPR